MAGEAGDDLLELGGDPAQVVFMQRSIVFDASRFAGVGEHFFKRLVGKAQHDGAEHLHEPSIRVINKARIAGQLGKSRRDLFV